MKHFFKTTYQFQTISKIISVLLRTPFFTKDLPATASIIYETNYSRMDQVKFVEDSLQKI